MSIGPRMPCPRCAPMIDRLQRELAAGQDEARSLLPVVEAERDRLRGLWESVRDNLTALRQYEENKGGQRAGMPQWLSLKQLPSMRKELEWLVRAALETT